MVEVEELSRFKRAKAAPAEGGVARPSEKTRSRVQVVQVVQVADPRARSRPLRPFWDPPLPLRERFSGEVFRSMEAETLKLPNLPDETSGPATPRSPRCAASIPLLLLAACSASSGEATPPPSRRRPPTRPFAVRPIATFDEPWAMTFLPGPGTRALITEKKGKLKLLWNETGRVGDVAGAPAVDYGGQGGFGDVVLHPDFARNRLVYLSWVEAGEGDNRGAVVGRARLVEEAGKGVRARRAEGDLAPDPEARRPRPLRPPHRLRPRRQALHLQRRAPGIHPRPGHGRNARQDRPPQRRRQRARRQSVRLAAAESPPRSGRSATATRSASPSTPRAGCGTSRWARRAATSSTWSFAGRNYGYPIVSNGDHYDGKDIPDHPTRPEFEAPKAWWTPVISPGDMIHYSGKAFPQWKGDVLIAGLSSKALIRVDIDGDKAREAERWDMGQRIREVEQGPDGSVWLLEDGPGGRLLKLISGGA